MFAKAPQLPLLQIQNKQQKLKSERERERRQKQKRGEREKDLGQWMPGTAWWHPGNQPPFLVLLKLSTSLSFLFSVALNVKHKTPHLEAKGRRGGRGLNI